MEASVVSGATGASSSFASARDDAPVDVGDLRKHTRYAAGYNAMSPTVRDLWAVVGEMGRDDRALFLKFVTSCSRPPLLGFAHLAPPFTIQCVSSDGEGEPTSAVMAFFGVGRKETGRLPTASTCFYELLLPVYPSRDELAAKLDAFLQNTFLPAVPQQALDGGTLALADAIGVE